MMIEWGWCTWCETQTNWHIDHKRVLCDNCKTEVIVERADKNSDRPIRKPAAEEQDLSALQNETETSA